MVQSLHKTEGFPQYILYLLSLSACSLMEIPPIQSNERKGGNPDTQKKTFETTEQGNDHLAINLTISLKGSGEMSHYIVCLVGQLSLYADSYTNIISIQMEHTR